MNLQPNERNAVDALHVLLQTCGVRITRPVLRQALWQHPDFPSMAGLSGVLEEFRVPNLAARLTPERLEEVPLPALAYLPAEGGLYAPVRRISAHTVEWLHTRTGWQTDSRADFLRRWDGVMLLIEPNEQSGDVAFEQNRKREFVNSLRAPFIAVSLLACLGLVLWRASGAVLPGEQPWFYGLVLAKLLGAVVSGALVWYGIDDQNEFLKKVCQLNRRTNCQNILNTSAARLTSWLSWADVGALYFTGSLLALLFYPLTTDAGLPTILFALTCLALPYTVWSVYYQAFVAREWCILCLTVQGLLWAECWINIGLRNGWNGPDTDSFLIVGGCFLLPAALWTVLKPNLQKANQLAPLYREFQRVKFSPEYVQALLSRQQYIPPIFEVMNVVRLGNGQSDTKLILVSNPTCSSCKDTHLGLVTLLENGFDADVCIILAAALAEDDVAGKVARQVLSLPAEQMADALQQWHQMGESHFDRWSQQTGGSHTDKAAQHQQMLHLRWLELAGVTSAPATFLNGAELPKIYQISELPKLCSLLSKHGIGQFT